MPVSVVLLPVPACPSITTNGRRPHPSSIAWRDGRAGEPLGDRDGRSLAAAVLAGGARSIGEHEDVFGVSQLAQRFERSVDRRAYGAFERYRPRVTRREGRVEFGQPFEQLRAAGRK